MVARPGSWARYSGRLPIGTNIRIFADGGDKEGRYRQYQERQEWFFVLDREAEELVFIGEYAGRFEARMRSLDECNLIRKKAMERVTGYDNIKATPRPKAGWDWEHWK